MRLTQRAAAIAVAAMAMTACSKDMSDLEQYVATAKDTPKTSVPPLPQIEPHQTFKYQEKGRRDPFTKLAFGRPEPGPGPGPGTGPRPIKGRPKEPLEAFPLDALRMVGMLEQHDTKWALVRAADGTIHRVTTGNYMGQNHGKIIRITENQVELTEIVPDGRGGYMDRRASLALTE